MLFWHSTHDFIDRWENIPCLQNQCSNVKFSDVWMHCCRSSHIQPQSTLSRPCHIFSSINTLDGGCWFGPRSHFNNNHLLLLQSKGMSWFDFDPNSEVQYLFSCPLGYPSNPPAVAEEYQQYWLRVLSDGLCPRAGIIMLTPPTGSWTWNLFG